MLRKTLKISALAVLIGLALPAATHARAFDSTGGGGHFRTGAHFGHPFQNHFGWNHFGFRRRVFLGPGFGYAGFWGAANPACYSNFGWPRLRVGYLGNPIFHPRHRFRYLTRYWGGANFCSPYWGSPSIMNAGWGGPFWGNGWNSPFWGTGWNSPLWAIGWNTPFLSNAWAPLF
jgi:hypothetical protein